jgi:hypothetical protein
VRFTERALYGQAIRLAGGWASSSTLPLRAVAFACLTAVCDMRTIALPGKGRFYMNSLTFALTPGFAAGCAALARMPFCSRLE